MPATISTGASTPRSFGSPIEVARYGAKGAGVLFVDREGKTFIGAVQHRPPGAPSSVLKLIGVDEAGRLLRMAEPSVCWPVRIAPPDHTVTFKNEE